MRILGIALLYALGGFVIGALAGYFLIALLSGNTHDIGLEAAMTAVFGFGPLSAVAAGIAGAWRAKAKRRPSATPPH